jgi:hypothetical protein
MYQHWLTFAGTEVISTARAGAYARSLGITDVRCSDCLDVTRALKDQPYTTPDLDDAPWYDPGVPASARFGGVVGLSIMGLSAGTGTRPAVPVLGGGAVVGQLERGPREVSVKGLMLAADDEAMSYGLAWLASALRGSACSGGCDADDLCVFAYCPTCATTPPTDPLMDTCGDDALRRLYGVGLLGGPTPGTLSRTASGGYMQEVEFGFTAGYPSLWREPTYISGTGAASMIPGGIVTPGAGDCSESTDCALDPDCPPPAGPVRPPAPPDPCYPTDPFTASRAVVTVTPTTLPQWLEFVPIVEVQTGDLALRRLTIRFYSNPAQYACTDYIDPCSACAEINIPYLPASTRLRVDGRTRRAWLDCPGGPGLDQAEVDIFGPGGGPFEWPVFDCSSALCVEFISQADTVAANSRLDLWMAAREDAA